MFALEWNPLASWALALGLAAALSGAHTAAAAEGGGETARYPVVPGFERFHAGEGPGEAALVEGGLLLLGELNCTSCHAADGMNAAMGATILRKQAPILDAVGSRVRPSYLRAFLSDPHAVKPGTTMPDLFALLPDPEKRATVEALVHFLAATGSVVERTPTTRMIAAGKALYHQIGCVACHGRRDKTGEDEPALAASMPLGDLAGKYSVPSLAAFLADPLKVRPSGRMPALGLARNEPLELATFLLEDLKARARPNLAYRYYEGDWESLPDLERLTPVARGTTTGFDLEVAKRPSAMALRFEGFLQINRAGEYTFHLTSDDGSRLYLDEALVIDNDGVHAPETKSQRIELTKGMHRMVVAVFNSWGECELDLEYEGRGLVRQSALSAVYLEPDDPEATAVIAAGEPISSTNRFQVDQALAEKGRALFARVGCASCHTFRDESTPPSRPIVSTLSAPSLAALAVAARAGGREGCIALSHADSGLVYRLSDRQRAALRAALRVLGEGSLPAPGPRVQLVRTLTAFNCYACHVRDRIGGVEEARQEFFTTTQKEMGDEGRIPPSLDGVGAKLQPAYLKKYLDTGLKDRPYMLTRMPRFGAGNVEPALSAFAALDAIKTDQAVVPVPVPEFSESPRRVKSVGRFLVGGEALGCIKCHTFKGIEAEGVQGVDLTVLTRRLRREWFHRYLVDPQAYRPGTRMPGAWPGGKTLLPQVLEGDSSKQIEAIWRFLADGSNADEPYGLGREPMPLVPEKEAIVYRNFLKGAGPRAIGAGYPERVNLAFDASALRLALVWQGAFIDASRHWSARGGGFQPPLGNNVLTLPEGPSLALLSNPDEPWPNGPARDRGDQFRGYRLSGDGRPTFLYDVAGVHVADFPDAGKGDVPGAVTLIRTLTLSGTPPASPPPRALWFRALAADRIEPQGAGWYTIDGEWRMRIQAAGDSSPILRKTSGKTELLVPIRSFGDQDTRIVQEFVW
jgi:mono/diheme cytochrome c family protein